MSKADKTPHKNSGKRFAALNAAALVYGERSFDNYAQIRSVAEKVRDGFCQYLDGDRQCVFLVPPQGQFQASNYGSAAYSVAGQGVLPLEPISFGLAVRVTEDGDFMRLVAHCRKEGERMFIQFDAQERHTINLPIEGDDLKPIFEGLYRSLLEWFEGRVEQYDHGSYGSSDIGFDIQRVTNV